MNWDPVDKTVLADEQVDINGCSWRSGAKVEKKLLKQWFVRTTKYAKELLDGLNDALLDDWNDVIKLQRHWIGQCNGVNFDFMVADGGNEFVTVWTPNPEYIEYTKFLAVNENHILTMRENVDCNSTVKLKAMLINPISLERIPVFATKELEFPYGSDSHVGKYV